jgi:hypothetical protein
MTADVTARVSATCIAFPEVTERPSHGTPTWFIRGKKSFAMLWPHGHHDDEFPHLWCAAPPGVQQELIAAQPDTFFYPPYVGHRGWVGVRLVADTDRLEVAEVLEDAYRAIAPKTLIAVLDAGK